MKIKYKVYNKTADNISYSSNVALDIVHWLNLNTTLPTGSELSLLLSYYSWFMFVENCADFTLAPGIQRINLQDAISVLNKLLIDHKIIMKVIQ